MEPPPSDTSGNRAEAERLLGVAAKLLGNRDLTGSREFAVLAQEAAPLLDGSDQILAICDVLIASDKPRPGNFNSTRNPHDWYSILQLDRRSSDIDLIKRNYRRLALLLHPDKNRYPLADSAFRLVADAWANLSDPVKKLSFDSELARFVPVDLTPNPPDPKQYQHQPQPRPEESTHFQHKIPVRRSTRVSGGGDTPPSAGGGGFSPPPSSRSSRRFGSNANAGGVGGNRGGGGGEGGSTLNFWTACPYCYLLYEYPRVYEDCCLRCQSCERAFHAASVPSLPPLVPGKEAYYCCWGFFPLGFSLAGSEDGDAEAPETTSAFPNWVPPMTATPRAAAVENEPRRVPVVFASAGNGSAGQRKRGRPRKRPL